jgi:carboxypeptidase family protein
MRTLTVWLFSLVLLTGLAYGQAISGNIVGTVVDASGAAVPNATITATNAETGVKTSVIAASGGEYRLGNLPVGTYNVTATSSGFSPVTLGNVAVTLNQTITVNLTLKVGEVTTVVEVQEAGAAIDTSTAQLQTAFDAKQAVDVPLAGISRVVGTSGIYNLSLTSAGVATSGGVGQGTGPSISGQRPENNTFTVDGVDNDDRYVTGPAMVISNEAIAQFNVLQNQFSAEFGGASGGVFNLVVKSGTNSLHGSIYEYFQNRDLNAMDAQYTHAGLTSLPRYDSNRLGATVGGPIIKNKLFYFGNYEYNPLGQASVPGQTVDAPTSDGISLLNGMSSLSKTNLGILEKYLPVAPSATDSTTVNGVKIPIGPLSFASPNFYNTYLGIVAIDYNISDKDQVRGRYVYSNYTGIDFNAALPVFFQPSPSVARSGSISEFHNFSATMENELRVSFRRFTNNIGGGPFKFPGLDAFPNLSFDDLNLQMGPDPNTPTGEIANNLGIQENLTKTLGRHTIKAGYSLSDVILTGSFVQRARGDYDYVNLEQYLLDQAPTGGNLSGVSGERSVGANNGVPFGFLSHAAFVNDDFRLRPNLTLNLGVRYEYVTMPVGSRAQQYSAIASVPGVITFNKPHFSPNDWSPRIGFAYSPGKNNVWSIRGGFARSFDLTYINLNQNASPPFYQTTRDCPDACAATNFLGSGGLTATLPSGTPSVADARGAVASYTFSNQRPYALTGSLGVQRVFARDYTVEARYVYTKGVHLWNQTRMNILSRVTPTDFLPTFFSMPDPSVLAGLTTTLGDIKGKTSNYMAQYGLTNSIVGYHPWGNSRYNGLQLQVNKRYSRNFSYIVAYTWSHNFDDSTATNFSTILSPRRAQDFQNLRAEWASSALDRRHRFTFTPIYDFKPFQNGNWMMKNVVGNWNISGTYTFQSPEYATVQSGVDSNLNGDTAGDRAIINPAGASNIGSGVIGYNALGQVSTGDDIVAYVADKSNARYVVAGKGARSNGGRNTFPLDHTNNFDFALTKRINITERFRFDIGAQAFNLFNHAQFVGGYLNDVNPYSTASISRAFLVPSSTSFGAYNQGTPDVGFFPSNSRQVQLVAHFVF